MNLLRRIANRVLLPFSVRYSIRAGIVGTSTMEPKSDTRRLKLNRLEIKRERSLQNLDLRFERDVTVLAGPNGVGKTTLLESIWACLCEKENGSSIDGVREVSAPGPLGTKRRLTYYRSEATNRPSELWRFFGPERSLTGRPAASYLWHDTPLEINLSDVARSWAKYLVEEKLAMVDRQDLSYRDPGLEHIRKTLRQTEAFSDTQLKVDGTGSKLTFQRGNTEMLWQDFSSGERSIFALVVGLAMLRVNVEKSSGSKVEMVIAIDEIELHLHPKWQRLIVPTLRQAFPDFQFIITTHSPQVIGSVEARCVRLLSKGENGDTLVATPDGTKGADSNFVIEALMGGDDRDPGVSSDIKRIEQLIDQGALDEAQTALDRLDKEVEAGKSGLEALRFQISLRSRKTS